MIYANPCNIAHLVREKSFTPIAKPVGTQDETVIVSRIDNPIVNIESLKSKSGVKIAMTDVLDVNTIGMIMLEPADLTSTDVEIIDCSNYITVAKKVINGEADIGFVLADAFDDLSKLVKKQIHSLISNNIHVLHHALLIGPDFSNKNPLSRMLCCQCIIIQYHLIFLKVLNLKNGNLWMMKKQNF